MPHSTGTLGATLDPDDMRPVNYVISAGTHCYASFALKQLALKKYSLPFDWAFSSLGMVADCLENDFSRFLDPRFYSKIIPVEGEDVAKYACDHLYYRDKYGVRAVFNHYNLAEDPQAREYFSRCTARFRQVMRAPGRKLFLSIAEEVRAPSRDFMRLANAIDSITQDAELLVIRVPAKPADRYNSMGVVTNQVYKRHRLLHMNATSKIGPISFASSFDDLVIRRFIKTYAYDLKPLD